MRSIDNLSNLILRNGDLLFNFKDSVYVLVVREVVLLDLFTRSIGLSEYLADFYKNIVSLVRFN